MTENQGTSDIEVAEDGSEFEDHVKIILPSNAKVIPSTICF